MRSEATPLINLRQLYDLQELDLEIGRCQSALVSVEARLRDDTAPAKARAEVVEWEERVRQLQRQHVSQAQVVQELHKKAQALEQRLYGGSIRNPKELESIQAELQYGRTHTSEEEDKLLNLMISLEEAEEHLARSRVGLEHTEREWAEAQAALTKEQASLAQRLQALDAKRPQLTFGISPALMTQYEQVRKVRQGQAVARVERGMCMGCRLALPATELQRVRTAQEPVTCGSCGRILYAG